jgi:maltose alpha-D-glucosyltransferase/alpha-amylase
MPGQRWFRDKGRVVRQVRIVDAGPVGPVSGRPWLAVARVEFTEGPATMYALPLTVGDGGTGEPLGSVEAGGRALVVRDALADPTACRALLGCFARGGGAALAVGRLRFTRPAATPAVAALTRAPSSIRRLEGEQSNTCVVFGEALILKVFRRMEPGINPDAEVTGVLTTHTAFRHLPHLFGALDYVGPDGTSAAVAILQRFVPNRGDGWTAALGHLERLFHRVADRGAPPPDGTTAVAEVASGLDDGFVASLRSLGEVTAELHAALASVVDDPAFAPEPIGPADTRTWQAALVALGRRALAALDGRLAGLPGEVRSRAVSVLARSAALDRAADALGGLAGSGAAKIRIHGDYHLGQTLRTPDDYVVFDFEGEPARPLPDRRTKQCPLRDVAGMLRSFDYAAWTAGAAAGGPGGPPATAEAWARAWRRLAEETFLDGYRTTIDRLAPALLPRTPTVTAKVLGIFELEKALYELDYELDNRPGWVEIPLAGLDRLLGADPGPRGVWSTPT